MRDLLQYRPNVGLALFSTQGRVFVGRRLGSSGQYQWQMPQGGVDEGEEIIEAALRELNEEVGISHRDVQLLEIMEDWQLYEFPPDVKERLGGPFIGQKQKWCAFQFLGTEGDIRLDLHEPEFDAWCWVKLRDTPSMVVPFKRNVYIAMAKKFEVWAMKIPR